MYARVNWCLCWGVHCVHACICAWVPAADAVVHAIWRRTLLLVYPRLCESLAFLFEALLHLCGCMLEGTRVRMPGSVRAHMHIYICICICICQCVHTRITSPERYSTWYEATCWWCVIRQGHSHSSSGIAFSGGPRRQLCAWIKKKASQAGDSTTSTS